MNQKFTKHFKARFLASDPKLLEHPKLKELFENEVCVQKAIQKFVASVSEPIYCEEHTETSTAYEH